MVQWRVVPRWRMCSLPCGRTGCGSVLLAPMMLVAGDHACNDMAGDGPDSWKSVLTSQGFEVSCCLQGLGELADIRKIYLRHLRDAEPVR